MDPDNGHLDPVETLKAFYTANPKACIHIVSAAYTQAERDGIEKLAAVSDCARVDNLDDLMKNEALWKNFVEEVFYKDCSQVETVELRGINFAFDKSEIGKKRKEDPERCPQSHRGQGSLTEDHNSRMDGLDRVGCVQRRTLAAPSRCCQGVLR